MSPTLRLVAAFTLLGSLGTPAAWADRTSAAALAEQARKAAEEGDAGRAEALWERATREDDTYLPARLGLAEAWLARGQVGTGLPALRAALEAAAAQPEAAGEWAADITRSRRRLAELDAAEAAVKARLAKHIEASLALAAKWSGKDPELARGALQRVLRLDPENAEAKRLMGTLGEGAGRVVGLYNGRNAAGWVGFGSGWKAGDGLIQGDVGPNGTAVATEEKHTGDFDFRAEIRLLEKRGDPMMIGVALFRTGSDVTSFVFAEGKLHLADETSTGRTSLLTLDAAALEPPLDLAAWNRFEVRVRGNKLTVHLNGKQVGEAARHEPNTPVQLGVRLQQGRAEFRALELRKP
jgi:tetratricopeptide (TPR) repeat protein